MNGPTKRRVGRIIPAVRRPDLVAAAEALGVRDPRANLFGNEWFVGGFDEDGELVLYHAARDGLERVTVDLDDEPVQGALL